MKSSKGRASAPAGTGMKNHQLEGDGVVTGFYNFLHKRHPKTMKACKDVLIPDTIVFDHNFPRGWFTSDLKSKEITKKQGKELDAASIANSFCKPPSPAVNIVATYMCSYEEEDPQTREVVTVTSVEFFNEETLKEFVARKTKREGILQRFIAPKGLRNNVIQAIWSPRLCMVQRRTNRGSVKDKIQCERDPYPVAVTYEGPSHFSEESTCAAHTTDQVKAMCANIAKHFNDTEHKFVTRMVLYFKVDDRDQLWLLWCGSLRVSDKEQPSEMPLNLAPKFDSPSLEAASPKKEEAELHAADLKHLRMTNDTLFYSTYVKNHEKKEATAGGAGSHQQQHTATSGSKRLEGDKDQADDKQLDDEEWHKLPGIQDQYRELCIDRENVLSTFDDIFYEAYGHFLRYDPGPFVFEVERKTAQTLGIETLSEMMKDVKIDKAHPSDDGTTAVEDEELWYSIPVNKAGPVKQLGDIVARKIREHYDKCEQALKEDAKSAPLVQEDRTTSADTRQTEPKAGAKTEETPTAKEEPKEDKAATPNNNPPAAEQPDHDAAVEPTKAETSDGKDAQTPAAERTVADENQAGDQTNASEAKNDSEDQTGANAAEQEQSNANPPADNDDDNWMDE